MLTYDEGGNVVSLNGLVILFFCLLFGTHYTLTVTDTVTTCVCSIIIETLTQILTKAALFFCTNSQLYNVSHLFKNFHCDLIICLIICEEYVIKNRVPIAIVDESLLYYRY